MKIFKENIMNTQNENIIASVENQPAIKKEGGSISRAMKLMDKRPGALDAFMVYRNQLLENGPLSKKERTLIMLAATVALKSFHCIGVQTKNARSAGVSEEEIIQTMLIAGIVSGNSPLSVAYSSSYENESCR